MEPLVSICCTTYNHEKYVAQTLEGFLSQECDFPFEILVHDDKSLDGTIAILKDYASRYPDVIRPMFEEENQYSKGIPINETFNFPRVRGKYVALCEGDDVWIHPHKLQKQIERMEADDSITFSFTNGVIHDESGTVEDRAFLPYYESDKALLQGAPKAMSLSEVAKLNFLPTASYVFRADAMRKLLTHFTEKKCEHGDLRMRLYITAEGKAWYEPISGCMYRENVAGSAMQIWKKESRDKLFARCGTVVELCEDVDAYSSGAAHEALWALREHYLRVMVHNAPSRSELKKGAVGECYHHMPIKERLRCTVRLMLPQGLAVRVGKLVSGRN